MVRGRNLHVRRPWRSADAQRLRADADDAELLMAAEDDAEP
jgi:hypothetical protein